MRKKQIYPNPLWIARQLSDGEWVLKLRLGGVKDVYFNELLRSETIDDVKSIIKGDNITFIPFNSNNKSNGK